MLVKLFTVLPRPGLPPHWLTRQSDEARPVHALPASAAGKQVGNSLTLCEQDKNLHRAVAGGWNLKALAEGKIGTLV